MLDTTSENGAPKLLGSGQAVERKSTALARATDMAEATAVAEHESQVVEAEHDAIRHAVDMLVALIPARVLNGVERFFFARRCKPVWIVPRHTDGDLGNHYNQDYTYTVGVTTEGRLFWLSYKNAKLFAVTGLSLTRENASEVLQILLRGYTAGTARMARKKTALLARAEAAARTITL